MTYAQQPNFNKDIITENVVNELNERYYNTRMICDDNSSGYSCSGVMLRVTSYDYEPWSYSPTDAQRGAVSFSFLREDIKSQRLYTHSTALGIIFKPLEDGRFDNNIQYLTSYCQYPANAVSVDRTNHGCGFKTVKNEEDFETCSSFNVYDYESWLATGNDPEDPLHNRGECSFSSYNPQDMEKSISIQNEITSDGNNEMLISTWNMNNVNSIPIEALFYWEDKADSYFAKERAYYYQDILFNQYGKYIPVVGYRETHHNAPPFFVPQ